VSKENGAGGDASIAAAGGAATTDVCDLQSRLSKQEEKVRQQKVALKQAQARNKNIKKRLRRQQQKQEDATTRMESMKKAVDSTNKRLAAAVAAAERRVKSMYRGRCSTLANANTKLKAKLEEVNKKLKQAEDRIKRQDVQLKRNEQPSRIKTMRGTPPRYTDAVRQCCIDLLAHNVGINHVSPIIKAVLETLTPLQVGRLPSPATHSVFLGEAKQLVLTQLGEELLKATDITLHRDGTTKQGQKYYGAQVATRTSTLTIGLSEVKSGSAEHCFQAVLDMLTAVEKSTKDAGSTASVFDEVIVKIKNTMTDRSSVEKSCNTMLESFRQEVLPVVTDGWKDMSDEERSQLSSMNNFYCGLHFVVGLAEQAQETLKQWEKSELEPAQLQANQAAFHNSSESGTVRLVRTVCKALEAHCNEQSGNHVQFRAFLDSHGAGAIPLARFVGNRFNILFYNAGGVYYLQEDVKAFYDTAFGTPNRLHVAVRQDIGVNEFVAGCRALGIIDKLVTGPLWRKLEDPATSIADMGGVYTALCDKFDYWSTDSTELLDGSAKAFPGATATVDPVHQELFTACGNDATTATVLQLLCSTFARYSRRLLADHLPGGKFHSMTEQHRREAASVATTNVVSERTFAQLDRLKREKPNASLLAIEGMVLFAANKTSKWLKSQPQTRKHQLITSAMSGAESHRQLYKQRCKEIRKYQQEQMQKKEKERLEKETNTLQMKQQLSEEIGRVGLWTTAETVTLQLSTLPTNGAKVAALKTQIKFRKIVLQQPGDKILFQWSAANKQFSWQELAQNLLRLLETA